MSSKCRQIKLFAIPIAPNLLNVVEIIGTSLNSH